METQKNKKMKDLLFYGAMVFLFLYTFRKVNQGIDVTDTGYHFSNFMYVYRVFHDESKGISTFCWIYR